jgi:hypothetical protein
MSKLLTIAQGIVTKVKKLEKAKRAEKKNLNGCKFSSIGHSKLIYISYYDSVRDAELQLEDALHKMLKMIG